jgi:hypothetical protein
MRSVVDRNVVVRRIPVFVTAHRDVLGEILTRGVFSWSLQTDCVKCCPTTLEYAAVIVFDLYRREMHRIVSKFGWKSADTWRKAHTKLKRKCSAVHSERKNRSDRPNIVSGLRGWAAEESFESQHGQDIFLSSTAFRPALVLTEPPLSSEVNRPEREAIQPYI